MTFIIIFFIGLFLYVYAEDREVAQNLETQNRKLWFVNETEQVFQLPLGSRVQLNCAANDMESSNVTWSKNGSRTLENTFSKIADVLNNEDYGNYTCSVCCGGECIQKYFTIISPNHDNDTIPKLPYFIKSGSPMPYVKAAGNMVRFSCKAGGYPRPTVKWFKNKAIPIRSLGDIRYATSSIYIEDLIKDDEGEYTCVVCNYLRCIDRTLTLNVVTRLYGKPDIKTGYPKNVTASAKSTTILECPHLSDLHSIIMWYKCKLEIGVEDCEILEVDESNPQILKLVNVTSKQEGWYTCVVINVFGSSTGSAYLKIIDAKEMNIYNTTYTFQIDD